MAKTYDLLVRARGDTKDADRAMKQLQKNVKAFGGNMQKTGRFLTGAVTLPVVAMAAVGIRELNDMQKATAQTNAVLKSTGGVAGVTQKHVERLSTSLSRMSGIDDQLIQGGQNILLTFTKIGSKGGVFDRATKAALDLSVAFGKDMNSSAVLVGKALQDPIKGVTALSRVGVSFSQQQKKVIERLVETGKTAEAQKLILRELEMQVGGSAKAYGTTAAGAIGRLREQFSGIAAQMVTNLLPAMTRLGGFLERMMSGFEALDPSTKKMVGTMLLLGAAVGPAVWALGSMVSTVAALLPVILAVTAPMLAIGAATVALGAAIAYVVVNERMKQDEFRRSAQAALEQVNAMRSLKDMQNELAGARLSVREAALSVERAERTHAEAVRVSGRRSLEAREASAQLARARHTHREALKRETQAQKEATNESRLAIATVFKAQTALRDEVQVRKALVEATRNFEAAKTTVMKRAYSSQIAQLEPHLRKLESAHDTNQKIVTTALRRGVVTRRELMDREAQHLAPAARKAGQAAGTAMGQGFNSGFQSAFASMNAMIDQFAARMQAAQSQAGKGRSGRLGKNGARAVSPFRNGFNVVSGALQGGLNTGLTAESSIAMARLQGGSPYEIVTGADNRQSVSTNENVKSFLEQRKAASVRRLKAVIKQRSALIKQIPKWKAERNKLQAAARKRKLTKAEGKKLGKVLEKIANAPNALQALESEIVSLGGQIQQDADSLKEPTVDNSGVEESEAAAAKAEADRVAQEQLDVENFRRRALGLMSVEEQAELEATNRIRAEYGLPPVGSVSEITRGSASSGAGGESTIGSTTSPAPQLVIRQTFTGQPDLFAASRQAAWAARTAGLVIA